MRRHGALICLQCNSDQLDCSSLFKDEIDDDENIFIECHGATIYESGTNQVEQGVSFHEGGQGFDIVGQAIYAPEHHKKRRIKREAEGKIRRCRACQDYTVRMRRKEGADFFVPSPHHPGRKKLKSISHQTWEP